MVLYHVAAHTTGNDNAEGNSEENDGTVILDPMTETYVLIYRCVYVFTQRYKYGHSYIHLKF